MVSFISSSYNYLGGGGVVLEIIPQRSPGLFLNSTIPLPDRTDNVVLSAGHAIGKETLSSAGESPTQRIMRALLRLINRDRFSIECPREGSRVPWLWMLLAVVAVSFILAALPDRTRIPSFVRSDYCYLLIAADRMFLGLGLTTPLPFAPHQPWSYEGDWAFLTRWPVGYPMLICAVRRVLGVGSLAACQWISLTACAAALVGWFVWLRRCMPGGLTSVLVAAVGAGCSVSTFLLISPSTDLLVGAALPWIMLLAARAVELAHREDSFASARSAFFYTILAGLAAGGLFWIRYASIFVPAALGLFFLIELRRAIGHRRLIPIYAISAALPVLALLWVNQTFGSASTVQSQLNLGSGIGFDFSFELLVTAWWKLTKFGFYDYHWYSKWVFALWPSVLMAAAALIPSFRRAVGEGLARSGVLLGGLVVAMLVAMLVSATTLFSGKYDYIGLDRYYMAIKPLYFALFVTPLMLIPRRSARVVLSILFLVAASWLVQQEWQRPYRRWLAANREVTTQGAWSYCFTPGAPELYRWLDTQRDDGLIVVSNFQEYVALHTGMSVLPIPPDVGSLEVWIDRIRLERGVPKARVLFVLDGNDRTRDYFLKLPYEIIEDFKLTPVDDKLPNMSALVYEYGV